MDKDFEKEYADYFDDSQEEESEESMEEPDSDDELAEDEDEENESDEGLLKRLFGKSSKEEKDKKKKARPEDIPRKADDHSVHPIPIPKKEKEQTCFSIVDGDHYVRAETEQKASDPVMEKADVHEISDDGSLGKNVYPVHQNKDGDLHSFAASINPERKLLNTGNVALSYVADTVREGDETFGSGARELGKYALPAKDAAMLLGYKCMLAAETQRLDELSDGIQKASAYIGTGSGKISVSELSDFAEISSKNERMAALAQKGITGMDARLLSDYGADLNDLLLLHLRLQNTAGLSDDLKQFAGSGKFFNLRNKKMGEVLEACYKCSDSDVIRNIHIQGLKTKDIRRLLENTDKNGLSKTDRASLRVLLKIRKRTDIRRKLSDKISLLKLKQMRRLVSKPVSSDEIAGSGFRSAVITANTGMITASAAGHIVKFSHCLYMKTPVGKIQASIGSYAGKQAKTAAKYAGGKLYHSKLAVEGRKVKQAAKKAVKDTVKTAVAPAVTAYKASARAASKVAERIGRTKAAQTAAATARTAGRAGSIIGHFFGTGAHVALTPLRVINSGIAKICGFFGAAGKWILIAVGGFLILDMVLITLFSALAGLTQSVAEATMNVILCNDDTYVGTTTGLLQAHLYEKKAEAEAIGKGYPKDPHVFHGHTIDRYGHPDGEEWTEGNKIYYKDADGNIKPSATNNIKDIIVLAYVMMEADFDTDIPARDDLIHDLWNVMSPALTWKESSIYTCPGGCDTYGYDCDDSSAYSEIASMKSEGVGFYGSIVPQTAEGCEWDYYEDSDGDREIYYWCDGHEVTVCYGHKDIDIYITLCYMQDMWDGKVEMPKGASYAKYVEAFLARGGWTEDQKDWAKHLFDAEWFDIYGGDPAGSLGVGTLHTLSEEEVEDYLSGVADISDVSEARKQAVAFALSLVGEVPYYYGGKAVSPDMPIMTNYGLMGSRATAKDHNGRMTAGLDCFGFVQFALWHTLDLKIPTTTCANWIARGGYGSKKISASELQPGDMGVQNGHTGMFVGYIDGKATWVHCTGSGTDTVVVNNYGGFENFYNVIGD